MPGEKQEANQKKNPRTHLQMTEATEKLSKAGEFSAGS
jgi:hypothetical protein